MSAHVICESRLELARLLMADFDASVKHIVAQPFMVQMPIGGKMRRHVPDYLLRADGSPVVVDVSQAAPRGENRAVAHHRRRFGLLRPGRRRQRTALR